MSQSQMPTFDAMAAYAQAEAQTFLISAMRAIDLAKRAADPRDARDYLAIAERCSALAARRNELAERGGADVLGACRELGRDIAQARIMLPPDPAACPPTVSVRAPHLN